MMLIPDAEHDELILTERPLIVCDIDEVVLEFVTPFQAFLMDNGHELRATSFRLNGNVFSRGPWWRDPERRGGATARGILHRPGCMADTRDRGRAEP